MPSPTCAGPTVRPLNRRWRHLLALLLLCSLSAALSGCSLQRSAQPTPTRTPLPTYTPTPLLQSGPPAAALPVSPSPDQPTATLPPPSPAAPPTPAATETPMPTATPTVTPTPEYSFELEESSRFPSQQLQQEGVTIYAYVHDGLLPLANYGLRVFHDGERVSFLRVSAGSLPEQTRPGPSSYTRLTNLQALVDGPAAGVWTLQLVDLENFGVGPPAVFVVAAADPARELYVRYRLR